MNRKSRDPNTIRAPRSIAMDEAEFAVFKKAAKLSGLDRGPFVAMLSREYLKLISKNIVMFK